MGQDLTVFLLNRNGEIASAGSVTFTLENIGQERYQYFDITPAILMDRFTLTITDVYSQQNNGFSEIQIRGCQAGK